MRRPLLALALISLPAMTLGGEFALSPSTVSVDNGQTSPERVLTYHSRIGVLDAQVDYSMSPERFGWIEAQGIPSPTDRHEVSCQPLDGQVRMLAVRLDCGSQSIFANRTRISDDD